MTRPSERDGYAAEGLVDLFIDSSSGRGLSSQLYDQIRDAIADGRLRPGDQLPPSRQLAVELGLSRYTVTTAYGRLAAEGFVRGRAGGGSIVAETATMGGGQGLRVATLTPGTRFTGWQPGPGLLAGPGYRYDLRAGVPDPVLFPASQWRRRLGAAVTDAQRCQPAGDPAGEAGLRRAIASWAGRSRSVIADEHMVVVTSGAQHAVDLIARVLTNPGDLVAVENPGYLPVVALLRSLGTRVAGVPVDRDGLIVDRLPAAARLVYLTPSHQFPLGATLSMPRRRQLLAWSVRHNAAVIEDDYDSEFRHVDRPLEPLQRLDGAGRVIYLGSFSKTLSPTLRLGFAIVPPSLAGPVAALRQLIDWHPPVAAQLALAGFIGDGLLDRHIWRARRVYRRRHQILKESLSGQLATSLTPVSSQAGLHITAMLRPELGEQVALAAAAGHGIAVTGLGQYFHAGGTQPGLVIGFGAVATDDLPAALDELGHALAAAG